MIEILKPGPLTTVQDLGRHGYASLGVSTSGAADRGSLRLANRLVGNAEVAAGLELTYGGLSVRFHTLTTIALTGAPCPATLDGRTIAANGPVIVHPGQQLTIGLPTHGLRTYLAVRGGIVVPEVLGSRSTDTLSGIGPAVLAGGTRLPVGSPPSSFPTVDFAPAEPFPEHPTLEILPGPREDWFTLEAMETLYSTAYQVSADSNRIGARLQGPVLKRAVDRELPSEGTALGSLQVPPNGQPVLFLADHPVTGGYPVIAVIADHDLDRAAQLRPGQSVSFRPLSPHRAGRRRRRALLVRPLAAARGREPHTESFPQ
ncbi:biotin-dependent carboxyltransferase family protein [Streptomyces sp. NBC_01210]|uniref:5-oxoprolinase subunit C family protein n=1 Tax=Streptomyces sp. NBC_01210 TaxID=2903774 RepID=UPI002E0F9F2B|nr:biotin-dependent carboxyltransferase family protein [Streptomyces sp. NBC_01210]